MGALVNALKRLFLGRPLASHAVHEQRLSKRIALAIFSSDALSSTAYATEEILFVTALGASSLALGLGTLVPIAIVVCVLLAIVIASYRQVVFAYPNGGGAYVVSRENIGENASLVAGASLVVDYILTVAVSISAGVAAIISIPAFSGLADQRVLLGIGLIVVITMMNMRGVKESGRVFAIPTYIYLIVLAGLILYGLGQSIFGDVDPVPFDPELFDGTREAGGALGFFLILKGFSSGAVALTGIEAISNGVPSFRRPESRNAAITLVWMGVLLGGLFLGVSLLANELNPYPSHDRTVMAQLGLAVFGNGPFFVLLQFATAAVLTLAANTAYNGFPGLTSIIARDGYLPRQLAHRGDRLVFSNGIIVLAAAAVALLVAFGGITNALIPLYAVGVFTSFTLSQSGMVRHHLKHRHGRWRRSMILNAVGATATLVVLVIVAVTKFTSGAWVPIVVIPAIMLLFKGIKRHYARVAGALDVVPGWTPPARRLVMVVLAHEPGPGALAAISYARSASPDHLLAVSVVSDDLEAERVEKRWAEHRFNVPLELVHAPHGDVTAVLRFLDELEQRWPDATVSVLIPELYTEHWWQQMLHNRGVLVLKGRLLFRENTVVTSITYEPSGEPAPV
jgi:amino acid transporter